MLAHDCNIDHLYDVIKKERGFIRTLKDSPLTSQDVKDALKGEYTPISNKKTLELARQVIDEDREAADAPLPAQGNPPLDVTQRNALPEYAGRHGESHGSQRPVHALSFGESLGAVVGRRARDGLPGR